MKTIRQNCFETNSSSTHSLCIGTLENWDTIIPNENNEVILEGGEFGWQWEKFNDALTKANYCALNQENNPERIEMLKEVIKEETNCSDVILAFSSDYNSSNWSYIDHEGSGLTNECFKSKETLKQFIFNKNSWLYLGNDNSEAPNKFYDDPDQIYTHRMSVKIEGLPVFQYDLKSKPTNEDIREAINITFQNVRYNETLSKWEIDAHRWSSREVYFELDYRDDSVDFEKQEFKLVVDRWNKENYRSIILYYQITALQ